MALPKIKYPTFELKIPSNQKKELFRQFLVKEEKMLLMAKTSEDSADIFRAVKQVVNNCAISESFDIDKLTIFDLEYLFLQLRALSVNNIVKLTYKDNEDEKTYDFAVDLSKIEVVFPPDINKVIKITSTMGLVMKYPTASLFDDKEFLDSGEDAFYELILRCIEHIYDGDDIHDPSNYSKQEIEEYLDNIDIASFEKIQSFMNSVPKLSYKIEYKNSLDHDRVIELSTLTDFFTLG